MSDAAPPADFRDLVMAWLERRGWKPSDLATAADVSPSLLSKHLTDDTRRRVRPSPESLERYAPVLDIPFEELMRLCGYLPGEANLPPEVDQIEADVRAIVSELMATVRGAPPIFWPTMAKPLLDGVVDVARDMAQKLIATEATRTEDRARPRSADEAQAARTISRSSRRHRPIKPREQPMFEMASAGMLL
jgi:transcriptional regulator with XRE-family HTH domain